MKFLRGRGRVIVEREGWAVEVNLVAGRGRSKPRGVRRLLRREERRATAWARGGALRALLGPVAVLGWGRA